MIDFPYIQIRNGRFRYRRKVPLNLQSKLGKREIVIPLGKSEGEVAKQYAKVHAEAERRLTMTGVEAVASEQSQTAMELFRWAQGRVRELDPHSSAHSREVIAEGIARTYPLDDEGYPIGVSQRDAALLRALMLRDRQTRPEPSLEDVKRAYIREKVKGSSDERKKEQRVERVLGYVYQVLGRKDVSLNGGVRKTDAIDIRDHMLNTINSPATVKRYLNDLRAIFNFGIELFELSRTVSNPFQNLPVKMPVGGSSKDDRHPFSPTQLKQTRARVLGSAKKDLQLIWRMLEGTGCRLSEVAGLMVADVKLDHKFPHIDLVFHPHRRLKTNGSVRVVPLIGDALKAAQEAVMAAGDNALLFPAYGRQGGGEAASAALMKTVRKVVIDKKVTVHSLRHNMVDKLMLAGVPKGERDLILGHSSGAASEAYGGLETRIEVATKAVRQALGSAVS